MGGPQLGLWLADPASGALRQVDAGRPRAYWTVSGGLAWHSDLDRTDSRDPEGPGGGNLLVSLDPQSGAWTTWLRTPGLRVAALGAAPGGPVVATTTADDGTSQVLLVPSPGVERKLLWSGSVSAFSGAGGLNDPVFDGATIWFLGPPGPDGAALYRYWVASERLEALGVRIGRLGGGCTSR